MPSIFLRQRQGRQNIHSTDALCRYVPLQSMYAMCNQSSQLITPDPCDSFQHSISISPEGSYLPRRCIRCLRRRPTILGPCSCTLTPLPLPCIDGGGRVGKDPGPLSRMIGRLPAGYQVLSLYIALRQLSQGGLLPMCGHTQAGGLIQP